MSWDPADHPRWPAGTPRGGQFADLLDLGLPIDQWETQLDQRLAENKKLDAEYRPGRWRTVDTDEEIAVLAKDLYDGGREADPSFDREQLRQLAIQEAQAMQPAGDTVELRNGGRVVRSRSPKADTDALRRVADQLDELDRRNPAEGRFTVTITPADDRTFAKHDGEAETVRGEPFIRIKDTALDDSRDRSGFMPAADDHGRLEYVLAHEWGHAIDHRDDMESLVEGLGDNSTWLSAYGLTSGREAYAEAFAEWFLTKGHTDNKSAIMFAERYGWGQPW